MIAACVALAVLPAFMQETAADPVADVRRTIEKSLPFIEKKGVEWIRDRKCSSCHHVTFMLWSHREALERGFAVDAKKLDEWTKWAVDFSLTTKTKEGQRNGGGLDTLAQLILARRPYGKVAAPEGPVSSATFPFPPSSRAVQAAMSRPICFSSMATCRVWLGELDPRATETIGIFAAAAAS